MALADVQRLLTRLVTDAALRERFLLDPEAVAAELGFERGVAATLATIPPRQLQHYGASLLGKRRLDAQKCLPLTVRALGAERFGALFREYAAGSHPSGQGRHCDDAVAFIEWLRGSENRTRVEPDWPLELAAIEGVGLRMSRGWRPWAWALVDHSIDDLVAAARNGSPTEPLAWKPAFLVWFRLGFGNGRVHRLAISLPRWARSRSLSAPRPLIIRE
jgi:hypothetical protein